MFERVKTHLLASGAGPAVFASDLQKGNYSGPLGLEAWISNFGGSNVHICRSNLTLSQAQDLLESGISDLLMTVTASGPSRIYLPDDVEIITVLFEAINTSGQYQAVTTRVFAL